MAMVLGVLIPLGISIAVIGVGIGIRYSDALEPLAPWMTTWLLLAMIWMTVAGTGAVLYEQSEGVDMSHSMYLIATFATYGCLPGLLTGWYDGQRRKHLRHVSQREDQLAVLSRILRHNLRNEMNVILGHSETLLEDRAAPVEKHARTIHAAGQSLLELTEKERVLVEAVKEPPSLQTIRLKSLLPNVLSEIRAAHPNADLTVVGEFDYRVEVASNFERALREIIENAIQHNDATSPEVTIRAERTADHVRLYITDNGPGICTDEIHSLIGERPISPLNHGSGLGVRLANKIIEQSGGEMDLVSTDGEGTTVPVTIPAA